jgi:photosystem II PsbT protein
VGKSAGIKAMESVAYILILTLAIGTLFFAIAFREPPRIERKEEK